MEKERFWVKRIYFGAAFAAAAIGVNTAAVFAADANVTVSLDDEKAVYTYTAGEELSAPLGELFGSFEDIGGGAVKKTMTVTSEAERGEELVLSLRLSTDDADAALEYSPLDYYTFRITDPENNVIYDSAEAELSDPADKQKDITLGIFNTSEAEDTKEYVIEYGINAETAPAIGEELGGGVGIELVSAAYEGAQASPGASASAAPAAPATLKPKFELGGAASATAAPAAQPTATAQPAASEAATEAPAPTETAAAEEKERKIICGEEIAPGRYTVTGNANVKIETKDGEIISETAVTDGSDESIKGVKQFITSIEKGDVITITPVAEGVKASVSFEKTNSGSSSGTKNVTAASASGKSTASPTASASSKTNPKTGDMSLTTAVLGSVMGVSAAAAGCLEVVKRKKSGK